MTPARPGATTDAPLVPQRRDNFGVFDVLGFARLVLDEHGLSDWTVRWDRAKRRAGCCVHARRELSFSATLARMYPPDTMRDVVLHEVAHALAGPRHQHDEHWRTIARELGARPQALLPADLPRPAAAWVGTCPSCGAGKELHSTPRRVVSCGRCAKEFRADLVFRWTRNGVPTAPTGAYAKELRRLRRRGRL